MASDLFKRQPLAAPSQSPPVPAQTHGELPQEEPEAAHTVVSAEPEPGPEPQPEPEFAGADIGSALSDFGSAAFSAQVEAAGALEAAPRLATLESVYQDIALAWDRHVDRTQDLGLAILHQGEAALAQIEAERNLRREAIEAGVADMMKDAGVSSATARAELKDFISEHIELAMSVWSRLGPGLKLSQPSNMGQSEPGAGDGIPAGGGYGRWRGQAAALPAFSALSDDPVIRFFAPGLAVGAGLIAGLIFGSLGFGVFVAIWVGTGVALLRALQRSRARSVFEKFIAAAGREIARREQDLLHHSSGADKRIAEIQAHLEREVSAIDDRYRADHAAASGDHHARLQTVRDVWSRGLAACSELTGRIRQSAEAAYASEPQLLSAWGDDWQPHSPEALSDQLRLRLGWLDSAPLAAIPKQVCSDLDLEGSAPTPLDVAFPRFWDLGQRRSLMVQEDGPVGVKAPSLATGLISRALAQIPHGKLNLVLFDPIGLGRNYSSFLKLSDYSDQLISGRVWSEREHLRTKLKDLIEHIEVVTQKYLRSDFPDIESYNAKAGEIAEAYRLLVLADFPEGFDEENTRDLVRIVQNGPRCGVFALIQVNSAVPIPYGVDLSPIRRHCAQIANVPGEQVLLSGEDPSTGTPLWLDAPPPARSIDQIVSSFGQGAQKAMRVEVPFGRLLQLAKIGEDDWWARSSEGGIEAPLGPAGAKKVQHLRLGVGLEHHALIVGRPGSGKSNLIHVFVTTLARLYPPDEVQLYLVDFKKGVEFKAYAEAQLPHARVIAVESEREFGLSVLQGLDAELKSRGEAFRQAGAAQVSEYRRKTGRKLPRLILIVDEFQEFFNREDKIRREATILFDRLVRQGRAFGIHLILGTQSLANAGLDRSTKDQMAIRIALQCSETDSRQILDDGNSAARLLTRPGEAIYNHESGLLEGNSLFQVALFSDQDRARELEAIGETARRLGWNGPPPTIFEGHEPADLTASQPLMLAQPVATKARIALWLGEPTALRPPVSASLKRQSGRNLMVLARDEEQAVGVVMAVLCSIAAQTRPGGCRFIIIDLTIADAEWADHPEEFRDSTPHEVEVLGKNGLRDRLPQLEAEIARRVEADAFADPMITLVIIGLQRARDLRVGEDASMSMRFDVEPTVSLVDTLAKVLRQGPEVGVHTIIWCDTGANLERVLDRDVVNEIGLRVSGPLSGNESNRFYDDDVAAGIDKPHRMIKYDDDQVGVFELFRPYAVPPVEFLRQFGARLKERAEPSTEVADNV